MIWDDIKLVLNGFVVGAAMGFLWNPGWKLIKKIIYEAKVARNEWRKPRN